MNNFNKKNIFLTLLCGIITLQSSMIEASVKSSKKKIVKVASIFTIGGLLAAAGWYHKEYLGALTTHFIGKDIVSHEQKNVASHEKPTPLPNSNQLPDITGEGLVSKDPKETDFLDSLSLKYYNSLEMLEATLIAFAKSLAHQVNEQLNSVCPEE